VEARVTEDGLDGVWLFSTIFSRRVVSLAVRTTKIWEYTSLTDPDRVSTTAMPDDEVWSWLDMVLKVRNQRVIRGLPAFGEKHPPNLISPPLSFFLLVFRCPTVS
jgi:hypothetical protein